MDLNQFQRFWSSRVISRVKSVLQNSLQFSLIQALDFSHFAIDAFIDRLISLVVTDRINRVPPL